MSIPAYLSLNPITYLKRSYGLTISYSPSLLIGISFNRGRRDYSERDRLLLDLLKPHLFGAYRNAVTITEMKRDLALLGDAIEGEKQGLIILTGEGKIRFWTNKARQCISDYFDPPSWNINSLPEALMIWIRHQQSLLGQNHMPPPPPEPLVVEHGGKRLLVRLISNHHEGHHLLLEEKVCSLGESLRLLSESLGLSTRESEVLLWVTQGKTNQEIGKILHLSPRTVHKHLEHIYQKMGCENRASAIVQALKILGISDRIIPS